VLKVYDAKCYVKLKKHCHIINDVRPKN